MKWRRLVMAKIDELTDIIKSLNALIHQYQQQLAKESYTYGFAFANKKNESLEEKIYQ